MEFDQNHTEETIRAIEDRPPSEAVVQLVADVTDEDPSDLPPIYDTVDSEAVDALFQERYSGTLEFEYCGYTVVIEDNTIVTVKG